MEKKYDITLSFAGEDREYVDKVANFLKEYGVSVFYDKFEEADLWGKDLGIHFDTIYRKSARYCIPFISENYKKKIWTNYEIRNAISRAIEQNEEYILPVRFDDTEIEGIRPTLGFLDLRTKSPEELTNIILKKLKSEKTIPVAQIFQEQISDVINVAIYNSFYMGGPKVVNGGVSLSIRVTNKVKGEYRYF
ncbi:MAG: toll/interleukin-1 receptor domain-containing protein, partial [Paludibacter sp.]